MSEVNADGTLLNPQQHLLQEVQNLTNSLMAEDPKHQDEEPVTQRRVKAANGEDAGTVGGTPHMPVAMAGAAPRQDVETAKSPSQPAADSPLRKGTKGRGPAPAKITDGAPDGGEPSSVSGKAAATFPQGKANKKD